MKWTHICFKWPKTILSLSILMAISLPLTSCMSDDLSSCPPLANVRLHLTYTGDTGRLADYLSSADLYLFDEQERLVSVYGIDSQELEEEALSLWLEPGGYRVVCWGNTMPEAPLSTGVTLPEAMLTHNTPQTKAAFYAPAQPAPETGTEYRYFTLSVPQKGEVEDTIDFMPSHREITITVTGYTDLSGTENLAPTVELTHLPAGYNFMLATTGGLKRYELPTVYSVTKPESASVTLYTPFAEVNEETILTLRRASDKEIITAHNLSELLRSKGADPGYTGPVRLNFGFMTGEMEITLPGWNTNPIEN